MINKKNSNGIFWVGINAKEKILGLDFEIPLQYFSWAKNKFSKSLDSSVIFINASTRFTDGEMFGFGAEVGISTQKLHVRGPMGLESLTNERYVVEGSGTIRQWILMI